MRAAVIEELGATPVVREFDEPVAGEGQAVVPVLAGGLNPADLAMASGAFGPLPTPVVAGLEGIATLDGRRVYFPGAIRPFGSFAERTLIDPAVTFPVPDGLDAGVAVGLGIAGLAAWLPLAHHVRLTGGERVLVLGATGVAGRIAVQGAKLLGAGHVVAAGRRVEALTPLLAVGADAIAVLGDDAGSALGAQAGEGFDVVVDFVFGAPFLAALGHSRRGARLVVVGAGAGPVRELGFGPLQGKTVIGHSNGSVPLEVRRRAYETMTEHVLAGRIAFEVERFPLERIAEAWRLQAQGSPHRKLVIVP
jgi:NADPH2:quinone reductase